MDYTDQPIQLNVNEILNKDQIFHTICNIPDCDEIDAVCQQSCIHDYFEIDIVAEGSGIHRIENRTIPCKENDIYIVPPHIPHSFLSNDGNMPLVIRKLVFSLNDWFKDDIASEDNPRYCYGIFKDGASIAYAMLDARMREKIDAIFDSIECELLDKQDEWQTVIQTYLVQLFAFVSRYINRSIKNEDVSNKDRSIVFHTKRMIETEFENCELSLETIAKRLFVSTSYLSRAFKFYSGRLFSEYLREVRLNHAARLLKETDMTVEKIVAQCGLKNISAFYRNFRETFDMTPQIYRQIVQISVKTSASDPKNAREIKLLEEISDNLQLGKSEQIKELVQQAINEKINPIDILNQGLLAGMDIVGEKMKNNEFFVPEVLVASKAMNLGMQVLKPYFTDHEIPSIGKVCIGTVRGDLHDIGKNLVRMMMEGKGLEVIDLGTDVAAETFVQTAIEQHCQIICCSALLSTTFPVMKDVVKAAVDAGIREQVKIMIGGAQVTKEYCEKIGADCYTPDAASAADAAYAFCTSMSEKSGKVNG